MSEKYTTDHLVAMLGMYEKDEWRESRLSEDECNSIIAKLRAGEKLCEAISIDKESLEKDGYGLIVKAIEEYEEA